jgi:hypothetical protein
VLWARLNIRRRAQVRAYSRLLCCGIICRIAVYIQISALWICENMMVVNEDVVRTT